MAKTERMPNWYGSNRRNCSQQEQKRTTFIRNKKITTSTKSNKKTIKTTNTAQEITDTITQTGVLSHQIQVHPESLSSKHFSYKDNLFTQSMFHAYCSQISTVTKILLASQKNSFYSIHI